MEELIKTIILIVFASTLFRCVTGANITVGGASGWDLDSNIQLWSSSVTFNVGDNLLFIYTPVHDVLEVDQQGYDTCTISQAIATYVDGETVISLSEPGTRYFVCGRLGHCQQGLRLEVKVQAQPNNNGTAENDDNDDGNNNNGANPERRGGGGGGGGGRNRTPTHPRPPPSPARPRSPPAPPRDDVPDTSTIPVTVAGGPCQCSRAAAENNNYGTMPLMITLFMKLLMSFM